MHNLHATLTGLMKGSEYRILAGGSQIRHPTKQALCCYCRVKCLSAVVQIQGEGHVTTMELITIYFYDFGVGTADNFDPSC